MLRYHLAYGFMPWLQVNILTVESWTKNKVAHRLSALRAAENAGQQQRDCARVLNDIPYTMSPVQPGVWSQRRKLWAEETKTETCYPSLSEEPKIGACLFIRSRVCQGAGAAEGAESIAR